MGFGDDIMGTGMARGAHKRGKRIAFGDGKRIIWGPHSAEMFRGNPNIAPPGQENAPDIEWIKYFKGHRIYNRLDGNRWIWNYDFHATPGEFFFDSPPMVDDEARIIVIEPNVPQQKGCAPNKQWPVARYQAVADWLTGEAFRVVQPWYSGAMVRLKNAEHIEFKKFRDAIEFLQSASLYIGPEGGLHHAAAAVGIPAVVLFGGFIPPSVTGYDSHCNLTGGAQACGSIVRCQHCIDAMQRIHEADVMESAYRMLWQ